MNGPLSLILARVGGAVSMSEARRYIACDAVKINGTIVGDQSVEVNLGDVITIGKQKEIVITQQHIDKHERVTEANRQFLLTIIDDECGRSAARQGIPMDKAIKPDDTSPGAEAARHGYREELAYIKSKITEPIEFVIRDIRETENQ